MINNLTMPQWFTWCLEGGTREWACYQIF